MKIGPDGKLVIWVLIIVGLLMGGIVASLVWDNNNKAEACKDAQISHSGTDSRLVAPYSDHTVCYVKVNGKWSEDWTLDE